MALRFKDLHLAASGNYNTVQTKGRAPSLTQRNNEYQVWVKLINGNHAPGSTCLLQSCKSETCGAAHSSSAF